MNMLSCSCGRHLSRRQPCWSCPKSAVTSSSSPVRRHVNERLRYEAKESNFASDLHPLCSDRGGYCRRAEAFKADRDDKESASTQHPILRVQLDRKIERSR